MTWLNKLHEDGAGVLKHVRVAILKLSFYSGDTFLVNKDTLWAGLSEFKGISSTAKCWNLTVHFSNSVHIFLTIRNKQTHFDIWGSHSVVAEPSLLSQCAAVLFGAWFTTFRKICYVPSRGSCRYSQLVAWPCKMRQYHPYHVRKHSPNNIKSCYVRSQSSATFSLCSNKRVKW